MSEHVNTTMGTNGGWCGCGYSYADDLDYWFGGDTTTTTKEEVDEFYGSPRLRDDGNSEVYDWLRTGNAPVWPKALIDEALARVRTDEGEAVARLLASRKAKYRDGACSDLGYPPYSVEHGLLTWALRNLLHVVAAQYLGVYDAASMPDPTAAAALFADIKEVYNALSKKKKPGASPVTSLMEMVLLHALAGMNYARIAKRLLQDANQWHPYAGPHLSDEAVGEDASSDARRGSSAGATSEPTRGETDNPPTPPKKRRLQSVRPEPDADEEGATDGEDRRPTPKKTQGGRPGRPRGETSRGPRKPEKEW
jgi:hypothetical protein